MKKSLRNKLIVQIKEKNSWIIWYFVAFSRWFPNRFFFFIGRNSTCLKIYCSFSKIFSENWREMISEKENVLVPKISLLLLLGLLNSFICQCCFSYKRKNKNKAIKSKSAWRYLKRYLHICEFKLLCSPGLIILTNLFILKLLFWSQLVIYSVILVWGVQFSDILIYFSTKIVLEMIFNFFNYIESGK